MKVFGKNPTGDRLKRVQASPQYQGGKFLNQSVTPQLTDGATIWKLLQANRHKPATSKPAAPLSMQQPDFAALPAGEPVLIWFGHSSYYLQFEGLRILVDPVFSGGASPFSGLVKAFAGTDVIKAEDFPPLDIVLITHDHYDHMDYETILKLKDKTTRWITSLGAGSHLEYWGITTDKITELDWWEMTDVAAGITMTAAPARHFSGRGLKRAQTLWSSFVLRSAHHNYYLGGDSGYDAHFKEIGNKFGPFDLAILECGQYNRFWKHIHMMPEETAQVAEELGAKRLLPVHWGKFSLALHPWMEPIERLLKAAVGKPFEVLTPKLGVPLLLDRVNDTGYWWR